MEEKYTHKERKQTYNAAQELEYRTKQAVIIMQSITFVVKSESAQKTGRMYVIHMCNSAPAHKKQGCGQIQTF